MTLYHTGAPAEPDAHSKWDLKPYVGSEGTRNLFKLKVEGDEGLFGCAEGGLSERELEVEADFRLFLIGQDRIIAVAALV